MSRHHEIPATPDNMVWGYFDAAIPPVLEIDSGDSVTLTSWMAGGKAQLHEEPSRVDRAPPCGARTGAAGPGSALRDRPGLRPRGSAGRRAAGRHPGAQLSLRLGLHLHSAAAGHVAGGLRRLRHYTPGHRSRAWGHRIAVGQGDPARSVLRDPRGRAARALGPLSVAAAARLRRQHGQQGAAAGCHALSAGVRRGGFVYGRRRARRARATARSASARSRPR